MTNVGEVANTNAPEPVSSVIAAAKLALDGVPRNVATPAPKEVMPVPPLATGNVPVTPVVNGRPVPLVNTTADGVPRAGVTRVGLVANTNAPDPVSSVIAAAKLALDGVPRNVATPVPKDAIPVPPLATGRVPVTPVVRGNPVPLVNTTAEGVPRLGVVKTGLVDNTTLPVPVSSLINVASCAEVVEANCANVLAVVAKPVAAPV